MPMPPMPPMNPVSTTSMVPSSAPTSSPFSDVVLHGVSSMTSSADAQALGFSAMTSMVLAITSMLFFLINVARHETDEINVYGGRAFLIVIAGTCTILGIAGTTIEVRATDVARPFAYGPYMIIGVCALCELFNIIPREKHPTRNATAAAFILDGGWCMSFALYVDAMLVSGVASIVGGIAFLVLRHSDYQPLAYALVATKGIIRIGLSEAWSRGYETSSEAYRASVVVAVYALFVTGYINYIMYGIVLFIRRRTTPSIKKPEYMNLARSGRGMPIVHPTSASPSPSPPPFIASVDDPNATDTESGVAAEITRLIVASSSNKNGGEVDAEQGRREQVPGGRSSNPITRPSSVSAGAAFKRGQD